MEEVYASFEPILGSAVGAGLGILSGGFEDYWTDGAFAEQVAATMGPHNSAIFIMSRRVAADTVVPEHARFGGTILQTLLPQEVEGHLQAELAQAQAAAEAQATAIAEEDSKEAGPIVTMSTRIPGVTGNP